MFGALPVHIESCGFSLANEASMSSGAGLQDMLMKFQRVTEESQGAVRTRDFEHEDQLCKSRQVQEASGHRTFSGAGQQLLTKSLQPSMMLSRHRSGGRGEEIISSHF